MNSDIFSGAWKQLKGKARQSWADLTDDEIERVQGQRTEFEGLLQKKYGYSRERASQEIDTFMNRYGAQADPSNVSANVRSNASAMADSLNTSGGEDIAGGTWKQLKGKAQQMWGDLTNDEWDRVQGKRTEFEGLLQKKYGYTKQRAAQEVDNFLNK